MRFQPEVITEIILTLNTCSQFVVILDVIQRWHMTQWKWRFQFFLMFHTAHTKREWTMMKNLDHLIIYELTVPKNPGLYSILGDFQNKFIHLTSVQLAASTYYWISRKFNALSTLLLLLFRENFSVWKCEASHESATLT